MGKLAISGHASGRSSWNAVWDLQQESWSAMPGNPDLNATVTALTLRKGQLYAGIAMQPGLVRWDGSAWKTISGGVKSPGYVWSLAVAKSDTLFLGGNFVTSDNKASDVARWTGSGFKDLGPGISDGFVWALAADGNDVFVGGEIAFAWTSPTLYLNGIGRYHLGTDKWYALGSGASDAFGGGLEPTVDVILIDGSKVYVGGNFKKMDGKAASGIAVYNRSTKKWSSVGSGANNGVNGIVTGLALAGDSLYVGGIFGKAGGVKAKNIAKWSLSAKTWSPLGSGVSGGKSGIFTEVSDIEVVANDVYITGNFGLAGGKISKFVARYREAP
jgi:hypothetical protein